MSAAEDVARHIHGSLVDLRRRVDADVAIEVARAVIEGANRALEELTEASGDNSGASFEIDPSTHDAAGSSKH